MSIRARVVHEEMNRLYEEFERARFPNMHSIQEALNRAYEAGKLEAPDQDAARWRMFVKHFGEVRARLVRHVALYPKMKFTWAPVYEENVHIQNGAEWDFRWSWTERTGTADTIPKLIDLMLKSHKEEE